MAAYYGTTLRLSVFGESRAQSIGMSLEGIPAGEPLDLDALQAFLNRRAPGNAPWASARKEPDRPRFLSGLADGITTGEPITAVIDNCDAAAELPSAVLRPGHADWPAYLKYGEIPAGGGRFSGRLTAPVCIAGGICLQLLERQNIRIAAHAKTVAGIEDAPFDPMCPQLSLLQGKCFPALDDAAGERMQAAIFAAKAENDSVGGIIECAVTGLPAGLGDHLWEGMESRIAQLVFGIPGVKAIAFGNGFDAAALRGSENNDPLCLKDGSITAESNRHGGILGGMSTGLPLIFTAAVKPTPSIGTKQRSVDVTKNEETVFENSGRNDPCIVPRAVPVAEAMAALAVYDALQVR